MMASTVTIARTLSLRQLIGSKSKIYGKGSKGSCLTIRSDKKAMAELDSGEM
jgi:hypothetical protein